MIVTGFDALDVLKLLGFSLEVGDDLTGMVADMDILVNKILHKSFIEQGTEATAATAALLICCSAKPIPDKIDLVAYHPFLYLIREEVTGTVLFIGHVLNPIAEEEAT
jgi:serpin B